jgi:hypothetical protein
VQHPPAAKPRVAAHDEVHVWPGLAQPRDQQLQDGPRMMRRADVARPQIGDEQLLAAEHIERQEAPVAVITMVMPPLLVAMDAIISRIEIEDQLRWRLGKGGDEVVQQHAVKSERRLPVGPLLEPAERRVAGQGRVALQRGLPHQIMPQRPVVVEILIPLRDPVDTLPQQVDLPVRDVEGIARVGQRGVQSLEQTEPAVRLAQQEDSAIAGDVAALKVGLDFAAIEAWKSEFFLRTVWH